MYSKYDDHTFLPLTINEHGRPDGGDSLANFARYYLACLATGKPFTLEPLTHVLSPEGVCIRHPGEGFYCSFYYQGPLFWNNPKEVSRDQMKALMWVMAYYKKHPELLKDKPKFATLFTQLEYLYSKRLYMFAQNGDVMLPFFMAKSYPWLLFRDLEMLINLAIVCGVLPIVRHDKPWGFGKGYKVMFSWQDKEDWCDGDCNMLVDLIGSFLIKDTWMSKWMRRIYNKIRGDKYIQHYYRNESGNNEEIGRELALAGKSSTL